MASLVSVSGVQSFAPGLCLKRRAQTLDATIIIMIIITIVTIMIITIMIIIIIIIMIITLGVGHFSG